MGLFLFRTLLNNIRTLEGLIFNSDSMLNNIRTLEGLISNSDSMLINIRTLEGLISNSDSMLNNIRTLEGLKMKTVKQPQILRVVLKYFIIKVYPETFLIFSIVWYQTFWSFASD